MSGIKMLCCVSVVVLGFASSVRAMPCDIQPLVDTDGDGLHDGLECVLQLDFTEADSDADGRSDLQELVTGTNPLIDGAEPTTDIVQSAVGLYAVSDQLFLQVLVHRMLDQHVSDIELFIAHQQSLVHGPAESMHWALVSSESWASTVHGWSIDVFNYALSRSAVTAELPCALAMRMDVDGQPLFTNQVLLSVVDNIQVQYRPMRFSAFKGRGRSSVTPQDPPAVGSGGSEGGIVPVEPSNEPPPDSTLDEVCVQILAPIGSLGNGRIEYRVESAGCEDMNRAVCMGGCSATVGDTHIGLDIASLVGG